MRLHVFKGLNSGGSGGINATAHFQKWGFGFFAGLFDSRSNSYAFVLAVLYLACAVLIVNSGNDLLTVRLDNVRYFVGRRFGLYLTKRRRKVDFGVVG